MTTDLPGVSRGSFPYGERTAVAEQTAPMGIPGSTTEASSSRSVTEDEWYTTVFKQPPHIRCTANLSEVFSSVQSGILAPIPPALKEQYTGNLTSHPLGFRIAAYRAGNALFKPIVVTCSSVISPQFMAETTNRLAERAIGQKFEDIEGGLLTNGDAELRSYGLAIVETMLKGDIVYKQGLVCNPFGQDGMVRKVLLSTFIQPDFEKECSTLASFSLSFETIYPQPTCPPLLSEEVLRSKEEDLSQQQIQRHEREIKAYLAYQLNGGRALPSKEECIARAVPLTGDLDLDIQLLEEGAVCGDETVVKGLLESLIADPDLTPEGIQEKVSRIYVQVGEEIFPALMLLNKYSKTLEAELVALERTCPQGYVYTFDPPSIFATLFGCNPTFLNRFHILALKYMNRKGDCPLNNMRAFAFNDFLDENALALLEKIGFPPGVTIMNKVALFATGNYVAPPGTEACPLVLHNNSDGYGNNILSEISLGSMDGLFCCESTAGISLAQNAFPANALGYGLQLESASEEDDGSRRIEVVRPWYS